MKHTFIVANFKSNKTLEEGKNWLLELSKVLTPQDSKEIIVCPPFTLLPLFRQTIDQQNLPIKLGTQNISPFDSGPYTGEMSGRQIKEFADYVLVGHSERRSLFGESEEMVQKKVEKALTVNLNPIFFVQNINTPVPAGLEIVVYEPPNSISTVSGGIADDPKDVAETIDKIKNNHNLKYVLYGGSVNSQNVHTLTSLANVDGVVPGKASLDSDEFSKIIQNA